MKTKSRTVVSHHQDDSRLRHLPLVDLLVDSKTELYELALRAGLQVFTAMLEEDRTAICGPRYAHLAERTASRAGTAPSESRAGGTESRPSPTARADRRGRRAAADVPDDGQD
jgi:hypothetical protein